MVVLKDDADHALIHKVNELVKDIKGKLDELQLCAEKYVMKHLEEEQDGNNVDKSVV